MMCSSLVVFEFEYLRFGDSSTGLLENEDVFVNFIDAKRGGVPKGSQVVVVFSSVPDYNIFKLESG